MATRSHETVVGVFRDSAQAQQAVNELRRLGFDQAQIGVVGPGTDKSNMVPTDAGDETYASEGALGGLATGAGVGALWGLGILAGVLPAIGPAIAGGTLAVILSSTAAGAAAAGLGGALVGLGLSKEEADYYNSEFESGRTVVTVSAGSRRSEAESVLRNFGGYDIATRDDSSHQTGSSAMGSNTRAASALGTGSQSSDMHGSMHSQTSSADIDRSQGARATQSQHGQNATSARHSENEGHVTAFEERLHVEKTPVQTGSVNVRKETHTEHKTIDVPVQREEVVIERRSPTGRAGDMDAGQQEIHIPIREEQVNVEKEMVAKEEVVVSKRTVQDTEHVDETLRKEEIKVDRNMKNRGNDQGHKRS